MTPRAAARCDHGAGGKQLDALCRARCSGPAPAIEGKLKIPNLGPNRYALSVTPPDGSGWIQTTTLEGNHDWDAWVMEGATGLDTEFVVAGEPFPAIIFGYVPAPGTPSARRGCTGSRRVRRTIKGVVDAVKVYVPDHRRRGRLPGTIWGGLHGAKIDKPIDEPVGHADRPRQRRHGRLGRPGRRQRHVHHPQRARPAPTR